MIAANLVAQSVYPTSPSDDFGKRFTYYVLIFGLGLWCSADCFSQPTCLACLI